MLLSFTSPKESNQRKRDRKRQSRGLGIRAFSGLPSHSLVILVFRNQKHFADKIATLFASNPPPGWPGNQARSSSDYSGLTGLVWSGLLTPDPVAIAFLQ